MEPQTEYINGFTTPPDYFDNSSKQLLQKINNGGFVTPPQYFELAQIAIQNRTRTTKVIKLQHYWYAAAAVILVCAIGLFWQKNNKQTASVTPDEMIHYVMYSSTDDLPVNEFIQLSQNTQMINDAEVIEQLDEETIINEL